MRSNIKQVLREYVENKNVILTEQQLNETLLNEGWKDVLLGIALLTGVGLSKGQAQTAKNALSNDDVEAKIESVLQDTSKLNKITRNLPPNVISKIQSNADKALEDLRSEKGRVSSTVKVKDGQLSNKLKQGYAITDIDTETDTIKGKAEVIIYSDTIDVGFHSDNLFKTAGYELSPSGINAIQAIKDSIKIAGGNITGVNIESSTDKEPIKMGNDKLSKLRAESVAKMFNGVDNITINTLPDQGPDLYNHKISSTERLHDRDVTAKYRYVKVTIIATFQDSITNQPIPQVIEKNTITLVKTINSTGGVTKIHGKARQKTGHHKIKRRKTVNCSVDSCPRFQSKKLFNWLNRTSKQ